MSLEQNWKNFQDRGKCVLRWQLGPGRGHLSVFLLASFVCRVGTQALGPVTVGVLGWTSTASTFGSQLRRVHSWVLLRQPWRGDACVGHVEDVDPHPFLWLFNLNLCLLAPGLFTLI